MTVSTVNFFFNIHYPTEKKTRLEELFWAGVVHKCYINTLLFSYNIKHPYTIHITNTRIKFIYNLYTYLYKIQFIDCEMFLPVYPYFYASTTKFIGFVNITIYSIIYVYIYNTMSTILVGREIVIFWHANFWWFVRLNNILTYFKLLYPLYNVIYKDIFYYRWLYARTIICRS